MNYRASRHPRPGHTPSCPTPHLRPHTCICRSERLAPEPEPSTQPIPAPRASRRPFALAEARALAVSLDDLARAEPTTPGLPPKLTPVGPSWDPYREVIVEPAAAVVEMLTSCPKCFAPTFAGEDHTCRW